MPPAGNPAGSIHDHIAGIADGGGASMISTPSRGLGTFTGAVLRSVSGNLLKYASVPALVVQASDQPKRHRLPVRDPAEIAS
jgi:nucleotide-binding universal stress UspA family protein